MKQLTFLAIIAMTTGVFGCPGPNPKTNPCDGVDCGSHGDCVDGVCECDDGWQGEFCDEQDLCFGVGCGGNRP